MTGLCGHHRRPLAAHAASLAHTEPEKAILRSIFNLLVEAAGVEPASEIDVSQEYSCFVRFLLVSLPELRMDKMRRKLVR
jgi:hypothetical protein